MTNIKLSKGKFALVDDSDYEWLNAWKWHIARGKYAGRIIKQGDKSQCVYMHRFIMDAPKGLVVDHINGDPLDNRRTNLRVCTQSDNLSNQRLSRRNTSGYKGVYFDQFRNKWVAQTHKYGKHIFIGRYPTKEQAVKAHASKFEAVHGIPLTIDK